jgi:hypothetical protein
MESKVELVDRVGFVGLVDKKQTIPKIRVFKWNDPIDNKEKEMVEVIE